MEKKIVKYLTGIETPYALTSEEWDEWTTNYKSKFPLCYFIFETLPLSISRIRNRIKRIYWAIQHRLNPKHRYNVLHTGLSPGYYEFETRIIEGIFHEFTKIYLYKDHMCWTSYFGSGELDSIYKYITITRPKFLKQIDDLDAHQWKESIQIEEMISTNDTQIAQRIIEIRGYLWT